MIQTILNWLVSPHKSEVLVSNHLIIPSFPVKLGELVNSRVFHIFQAPLGIGSAIFANYLPVVLEARRVAKLCRRHLAVHCFAARRYVEPSSSVSETQIRSRH